MNQKSEVIKNMLIKSNEKLKMAELMLRNKGYDDSASRSYYAVFHIISAVLFSMDLIFSSHKEVIGAFNKYFIKEQIFPGYFSKKIEQLFRSRQTGDYDVKMYINKKTAEESYKNAKEIIAVSVEYLTDFFKVKKDFWQ